MVTIYVLIAIVAGMFLAAPVGRLAASRLFGPLPEGVSTAEMQQALSTGAWRRSAMLTLIGILGGAIVLSVLILWVSTVATSNIIPTLMFAPMIPAFLAMQLLGYRVRQLASFEALNRRGERSVCTRCGYVLTGSVSSQCPECGYRLAAPDTPDPDGP